MTGKKLTLIDYLHLAMKINKYDTKFYWLFASYDDKL